MQAPFEMTEGLKRLEAILKDLPPDSPHWNEAQNRIQFIDRLLLECLGWEHPYVAVEQTDEGGGRADYHLGNPIKAVLEAKREARRFNDLPIGNASGGVPARSGLNNRHLRSWNSNSAVEAGKL